MRTDSTPTGTTQTRGNQTLRNAQNNKFKIMPNTIQKWEGTGFPRVENMEEVRHPQPQLIQYLQSAGLIYPNRGMRKDSDL